MSGGSNVARNYWNDWKQMIPDQDLKLPRVQQRIREIEAVEQKIDSLKLDGFEKELWAKLGHTGELDSIVLRNYYREQVTVTRGTDREHENTNILEKLDQLYKLRKSKYDLLNTPDYGQDGWDESFSRLLPPGSNETRFSPGIFPFAQHFWAVVIGVDNYDQYTGPLGGCVQDARSVQDFLFNFLRVPKENVAILESPRKWMTSTAPPATRKNILDTLYNHLRDNPKIQHGDNIFIHYSGHGSEYDPGLFFPDIVGSAGGIEALCPVDRSDRVNPPILDISDRELNTFLSELRSKKGPNITLSLDCCHSGGGGRGEDIPPEHAVRSSSPLENCGEMLKLADSDPRRLPHDRLAVDPSWKPDETSFVALSASEDYELSTEAGGKGLFTTGLLRVLKSKEGQGNTYEEVISKINNIVEGQRAKAIGTRRGSTLWFQ